MPDSAPFVDFARALADVAETAGRHDKADRLGALLADLSDDDLRLAARWAAGRVFPLSDQRTVQVGFSALRKATAQATGADPDELQASLVRLGDPGDVAAAALDALVPPVGPTWTLAAADAFFADVAGTRGSTAKTARIAEMLGQVTPVEARFLVKLLAGETRIGMLEGGVEGAVSRLYNRTLGAVKRANRLTGDVGETAVLARHDRLADAALRMFHPIKFMLATAAEASDERTLAEEVGRQLPPPVAVEDKFDGVRAQVHVAADPGNPDLHGVTEDGARVAVFSRTLDAVQRAFPDLTGPLAAWAATSPAGVIVDGEIVPVDADGGPSCRSRRSRSGWAARRRAPSSRPGSPSRSWPTTCSPGTTGRRSTPPTASARRCWTGSRSTARSGGPPSPSSTTSAAWTTCSTPPASGATRG